MARGLTKEQLQKKLADMEQELHVANNSKEYWAHEYNQLESVHEELKKRIQDTPILTLLNNCSIIQKMEIEEILLNHNNH